MRKTPNTMAPQHRTPSQRERRRRKTQKKKEQVENAFQFPPHENTVRTSFVRREPYWTRLPENHGPNRIMPRPTYPRREDYQRDYRRDNGRNNPPNRPAHVHEIDCRETESNETETELPQPEQGNE
ncbi:hypothetical protein TKK_0009317 [Trichogramma kaykai]|uniref:Uncharacterized protein n=1 Tax=Trichogramma kaykai TaxID=54128 RepID=A0ABD2X225_9HYME